MTFKESGVIDEVELEASRQNIIKRYKSASHYYVKVEAALRQETDDDAKEVQAYFKIDEGPPSTLVKWCSRSSSS